MLFRCGILILPLACWAQVPTPISAVLLSTGGLHIFWDSVPGRPYLVKTSTTLSTDWRAAPALHTPLYGLPGGLSCVASAEGDVQFWQVLDLDPDSAPMVLIRAGAFSMGDSLYEGNPDERPVHGVDVSAFYMDRAEVTNDRMVEVLQWAYEHGRVSVSASSVRNLEGGGQELLDLDDADCRITWDGSRFGIKGARGSGYPCLEVTWFGAVAFCNYRSEMEGLSPCYNLADWSCAWSANGYRLPTESEWEKAARSGQSGARFPWGNTIDHRRANYRANGSAYSYDESPYTSPTYHPDYDDGSFPFTSPTAAFSGSGTDPGLYDLIGNVREWCWDWYSAGYYGSSPAGDPRGPAEGLTRVARGGSWDGGAYGLRNACRAAADPSGSYDFIGFRCVRSAGS